MNAIECTAYGPPEVLRMRDLPKPVPRDDEVLIRVRATTVSAADCELRRFDFAAWIWLPMRLAFGIWRPRRRVLGQDLAGEVEAVGGNVRSLRPGDRVMATTGIPLGAHAEYVRLPERSGTGAIAPLPPGIDDAEAAAVAYGGSEALGFLRAAGIRRGQRVLVNGAGGSFGTYAVQLAKIQGAHVTAVDRAAKLETLRAIGADRVVDFAAEDALAGGATYDVIFDVVRGTPSARLVRSLADGGCLLMANPGFRQIAAARWAARGTRKRVMIAPSRTTGEDLAHLAGLVAAGRLRPVIGRRFAFEQMIEAHRYAESPEKLGNVVVIVG